MDQEKNNVFQFKEGWKWFDFHLHHEDSLQELEEDFGKTEVWIKNQFNTETNFLYVDTNEYGVPFVIGSLNYSQDPDNPEINKLFHYKVSKDKLLTVNLDLEFLENVNKNKLLNRLNCCMDGTEGFLILIGELLHTFLQGIDDFEEHLIDLEKAIHFKNNGKSLEKIFEHRSEMLFLKQLVIPIEEILTAVEEAFLEDLNTETFKRTKLRLKRTMNLLSHYEGQIETLLRMNMNLYSYRGNEIIKALTVFTVLFTPITALGAIWGMNFEHIPEFKWKYGYLFAWIVIIMMSAAIYWWLYKRGWTGDILTSMKNEKDDKKPK